MSAWDLALPFYLLGVLSGGIAWGCVLWVVAHRKSSRVRYW